MGRRTLIEQDDYPYHLTARCINKEWFQLPMEVVWDIFQKHLFFLHHAYGFEIHAFVLMSNHYHMIARTTACNLSKGMRYFMQECTRYLNHETGRINQVWGGRFFRSMLGSDHYYLNTYKYLYYNPVQAGLCNNVLDYPYSALRGLLGFEPSLIPIQENTLWDMGTTSCLEWLNNQPSNEDWESMRKGLAKNQFRLAKCPRTNKLNKLEIKLL